MSKLSAINGMHFNITWKLIYIGLYGYNVIPPILTYSDVFEYLDGLLTVPDNQIDDIISLLCAQDNKEEVKKLLKSFSDNEKSEMSIQVRKWRALLLQELLDNISNEPLQGLLDLMEFWVSMGLPKECPFVFPDSKNPISVQKFFSQSSYDVIVTKNRKWLNTEILDIINS